MSPVRDEDLAQLLSLILSQRSERDTKMALDTLTEGVRAEAANLSDLVGLRAYAAEEAAPSASLSRRVLWRGPAEF